jgi:prepilin-type N-terminal cleavage/methylation domain-containing protein
MKKEQGFSLVELLIVVAIIAIIAAIAVPSLLTSRMAANEAGGIQGARTVASAQVAFAATNNQMYSDLNTLVLQNFLDNRYIAPNGFNGYTYAENQAIVGLPAGVPTAFPQGFGIISTPVPGSARYVYGIGPDQVVRYQNFVPPATTNPGNMNPGDGIGIMN